LTGRYTYEWLAFLNESGFIFVLGKKILEGEQMCQTFSRKM